MNQFSAKINKRTIGIVTIDVEPDNVWRNTHSKSLRNINELPNFHKICKEFGVRPTYFVCWTVANDDNCKKILLDLLNQGDCEIGIHPHLWEIPPLISQDSSKIAWTGPDYSTEILEAKLTSIFNLISSNFGIPLSHRAGRWGIDERQVEILTNLGIKYDSSILPGIDWSKTGILDHTKAPLNSYFMDKNNICLPGISSLLEVPCTIKPGINLGSIGKIKYINRIFNKVGLGSKWLRASPVTNISDLLSICKWAKINMEHINIMSHSSEFMNEGSPYWETEIDIKNHFSYYKKIFGWWKKNGIEPMTISEYGQNHKLKNNC